MTQKQHAPGARQANGGALQSTSNSNLNDTTTAAQRDRLLAFLVHNVAVNTVFARDRLNVMHPAAQIKELRDAGHKIKTDRIIINDHRGRSHGRVARYVLLKLAEVSK